MAVTLYKFQGDAIGARTVSPRPGSLFFSRLTGNRINANSI
jgi:hypothetical protein